MDNWIVILEFSCVLAAALAIYANYRRTKKTMDTIDQMLDAAVEGTYSETNFDESRLSALETKFAHYLSSSAISARNVTIEKDKNQNADCRYFPPDQDAHCQSSALQRIDCRGRIARGYALQCGSHPSADRETAFLN